jgi:hypothetical protein
MYYSTVDCEISVRATLSDLMFDAHFADTLVLFWLGTKLSPCAALTPAMQMSISWASFGS